MPATPPPVVPNFNGGQGSGFGTSFIGGYTNLPPGITNAGGTNGSNAYVRQVQPGELVSNQLQGLLAPGNAYIDQARLAGTNAANDRGMLNSSISAGNSEQAAIAAAAPIATANAQAEATAAGQNEDALNTILATRMNNHASMQSAADAAGASEYASNLGLENNRENRTYEGEQAGINRSFQDYLTQMGYGQQDQMAQFQLGGQLLQNNQSFTNSLYLNASQNPFMMNDPAALQGFAQAAGQGTSGYLDSLLNNGTNPSPLPQWQENSNWYVSPDFSQQYGDGTYAGGGPQLPYQNEPLNNYTGY